MASNKSRSNIMQNDGIRRRRGQQTENKGLNLLTSSLSLPTTTTASSSLVVVSPSTTMSSSSSMDSPPRIKKLVGGTWIGNGIGGGSSSSSSDLYKTKDNNNNNNNKNNNSRHPFRTAAKGSNSIISGNVAPHAWLYMQQSDKTKSPLEQQRQQQQQQQRVLMGGQLEENDDGVSVSSLENYCNNNGNNNGNNQNPSGSCNSSVATANTSLIGTHIADYQSMTSFEYSEDDTSLPSQQNSTSKRIITGSIPTLLHQHDSSQLKSNNTVALYSHSSLRATDNHHRHHNHDADTSSIVSSEVSSHFGDAYFMQQDGTTTTTPSSMLGAVAADTASATSSPDHTMLGPHSPSGQQADDSIHGNYRHYTKQIDPLDVIGATKSSTMPSSSYPFDSASATEEEEVEIFEDYHSSSTHGFSATFSPRNHRRDNKDDDDDDDEFKNERDDIVGDVVRFGSSDSENDDDDSTFLTQDCSFCSDDDEVSSYTTLDGKSTYVSSTMSKSTTTTSLGGRGKTNNKPNRFVADASSSNQLLRTLEKAAAATAVANGGGVSLGVGASTTDGTNIIVTPTNLATTTPPPKQQQHQRRRSYNGVQTDKENYLNHDDNDESNNWSSFNQERGRQLALQLLSRAHSTSSLDHTKYGPYDGDVVSSPTPTTPDEQRHLLKQHYQQQHQNAGNNNNNNIHRPSAATSSSFFKKMLRHRRRNKRNYRHGKRYYNMVGMSPTSTATSRSADAEYDFVDATIQTTKTTTTKTTRTTRTTRTTKSVAKSNNDNDNEFVTFPNHCSWDPSASHNKEEKSNFDSHADGTTYKSSTGSIASGSFLTSSSTFETIDNTMEDTFEEDDDVYSVCSMPEALLRRKSVDEVAIELGIPTSILDNMSKPTQRVIVNGDIPPHDKIHGIYVPDYNAHVNKCMKDFRKNLPQRLQEFQMDYQTQLSLLQQGEEGGRNNKTMMMDHRNLYTTT